MGRANESKGRSVDDRVVGNDEGVYCGNWNVGRYVG